MAKNMKLAALCCGIGSAAMLASYLWLELPLLLTLTITATTFFYHFAMRLVVGSVVDALMQNRADATRFWFRPRPWESKLYARLGVRKWRDRMPSYDPSLFSPAQHSYAERLGANCQAEVVHEIIILLSFLPLGAAIPFGAFWVFLITSTLSAAYDSLFVIMQRYARPHLIRAARYAEQKKEDTYDQSDSV